MKQRSLSPIARIALLCAAGLLLLCAALVLTVSLTEKQENTVTLSTGGHVTLAGAQNGISMLLSGSGDEYFAANWFPTLNGAKGDGKSDDTAALKETLLQASVLGGTVYLPRGTYRISEPIIVPAGVTLRGDFTSPDASSSGRTVLSVPNGEELLTTPFITLEDGANLVGITVYYEKQTPEDIIEYPATVYCTGTSLVRNIALINPYHGICVTGNGEVNIQSVWMSPLDYGILVTDNSEAVCMEDIYLSPTYWLNSVPELFAERGAYETMTSYLHEHLHGIILEQVCDVTLNRYSADDAGMGLLLNIPKEQDALIQISEIEITATSRPLYVQSVPEAGILFSDCTFRPDSDAGADTVYLGPDVAAPVIFSGCTFAGSPKTVIRGENPTFVSFYYCDFGAWWNTCFDMTDSTFLAVSPTFRTAADRAVLGQNAFGLLYGSEQLEASSELLFSVVTENAVLAGTDEINALKDSNHATATGTKIFNAADYGVSTGASDNSAALNEALAAAAKEGGIVFLAEGNYRCLSTVTLPESVRLIGVGSNGSYKTTLTFEGIGNIEGALIRLEENSSLEQISLHQGPGGESVYAIYSAASRIRLRDLSVTAGQGICLINGKSAVLEHITLRIYAHGIRLQSCTETTLRDIFLADVSVTQGLVGLSIVDSEATLSGISVDRLFRVAEISGVSRVSGTLLTLRKVNYGFSVSDQSEVFLTALGICNGETEGASEPLTVSQGKLTVQGMICKGTATEGSVLSSSGGAADLRAALLSASLPVSIHSSGDGTVSVTGCIFNSTPTYHADATAGTISLNGNLLLSDKTFEGVEGDYMLLSDTEESTVEDGINITKFTYVEPEYSGSESGPDASDRLPGNENIAEQ